MAYTVSVYEIIHSIIIDTVLPKNKYTPNFF